MFHLKAITHELFDYLPLCLDQGLAKGSRAEEQPRREGSRAREGVARSARTSKYQGLPAPVLSGNRAKSAGGAIYNLGHLTLRHAIVRDNSALHGGAIANRLFFQCESTTFELNGSDDSEGGALWSDLGSSMVVERSLSFRAMRLTEAAVYNSGVSLLKNTTLHDNTAADAGGGFFNAGADVYTGSLVYGRESEPVNGSVRGGELTLTNCTVANNTAMELGGGGGATTNETECLLFYSIVANNQLGGSTARGPDILNRILRESSPFSGGDTEGWGGTSYQLSRILVSILRLVGSMGRCWKQSL